jgi:hypothetical protein
MSSSISPNALVAKKSPRIVSEKSPIPAVWLDTSVGIKLVKIRRGEKLSDIEVKRNSRLRELVMGLVRGGKLICPMSDQEEEYEAERLDSEILAEFSRLSLGAHMNHRLWIQDVQIFRAMDAFCQDLDEIVLPWRIYFHEDPIRAVEDAKARRIFACAVTPPRSPLIEARRRIKQDVISHSEQLRQKLTAKGQPFEAQFKLESRALGTVFKMRHDYLSNRGIGKAHVPAFMGIWGFYEYITRWQNLGRDYRSLYDFLISEYITSLPIFEISAKLNSDLVTGKQAIMPGDSGDVDLLSTALPLVQFVVTDKKMENRIKRLGIDRKWGTKVFSMSTMDGLFNELEALW